MWIYNRNKVQAIDDIPEGCYGFIYLITNHSQMERNIRDGLEEPYLYIGKKSLWSETNVRKGKRELAQMTDKRGSKKKKLRKESNWLTYNSSNDRLIAAIEEGDVVTKEILMYCYSKRSLTYQEEKALYVSEVLEKWQYLNYNISGRHFRGNIG